MINNLNDAVGDHSPCQQAENGPSHSAFPKNPEKQKACQRKLHHQENPYDWLADWKGHRLPRRFRRTFFMKEQGNQDEDGPHCQAGENSPRRDVVGQS